MALNRRNKMKKFTRTPRRRSQHRGRSSHWYFFTSITLLMSQLNYSRWPHTKTLNPRKLVQVLLGALYSYRVPLSTSEMNPSRRPVNCEAIFSEDLWINLLWSYENRNKNWCKEDSKLWWYINLLLFVCCKSNKIEKRHLVECVSKLVRDWEDVKWKTTCFDDW